MAATRARPRPRSATTPSRRRAKRRLHRAPTRSNVSTPNRSSLRAIGGRVDGYCRTDCSCRNGARQDCVLWLSRLVRLLFGRKSEFRWQCGRFERSLVAGPGTARRTERARWDAAPFVNGRAKTGRVGVLGRAIAVRLSIGQRLRVPLRRSGTSSQLVILRHEESLTFAEGGSGAELPRAYARHRLRPRKKSEVLRASE